MKNLFSKFRLFWQTLRYSRLRQLVSRLSLMFRRRALSSLSLGRLISYFGQRSPPAPSPRGTLPRPVFPARKALVRKEADRRTIRFLNLSIPFSVPMDWRRPGWRRGSYLELLNLHYMEYLEGLDDDEFIALVDDWIHNNPPYRRDYWRGAWNSYALSVRCVVWMQQYALREKRLDPAFKSRFSSSLRRQIRFLNRNLEFDLQGNHLLRNCRALIWAGGFFLGEEADRWKKRGGKILREELAEQVLPDGLHYERSPAYHLQVFADLLECYGVMEPGSDREALKMTLDRMAAATVDLIHPDGLISLFNDGGLHMTYPAGEIWGAYNRLVGPIPVPRLHIEYPFAGYYGLRRGRDYLLVDCGEIGPDFLPAHGHGDILAFELDVEGRRIFVDPGVFEYHPGPARTYARSTAAHNTLTVDDRDQCEFWKSFRVGRRARPRLIRQSLIDGRFLLEGSHDGYRHLAGGPVHFRKIEYGESCLKISDRVEGGAGQEIKVRFLVHPDNDVVVRDGICRIVAGPIRLEMRTDSRFEISGSWYMPDFGYRRLAPQITVNYGPAPGRGEVCFRISRS